MKGIMELLGTAMFLGIVAFILFLMYQRNTHTFAQWGNKLDKYSTEADQVSQKVDRVAKALPRIYKKMRDEVNDIDDSTVESVEETAPAPTPPSPQPKPTVTVEPRPSAQPPINYSPRPEVYNTAATTQRTTTTPQATPPATTVATVQLPPPTAKGAYKIQVGRLTEGVNGALFNQLQTMGVVSYQNNGTDQVVLLGNYATKADADKVLAQVRKVGFKDAFVKMPSSNSTAKKATTNTEKCDCPKQGEGAAATTTTTTITTPPNGKVYVVQLGASQFPVLGKAKTLSNLGKIYTDYNAKTDLTKIMLGSFATPAQADAALQVAKKIGFSKAFVKNIAATDMKNWKVVQ
jgi:hypothetical protein